MKITKTQYVSTMSKEVQERILADVEDSLFCNGFSMTELDKDTVLNSRLCDLEEVIDLEDYIGEQEEQKAMKCDRCGKETDITIMSIFNTDILCKECKEEERTFPEYEEARQAERQEVLKGNHNFKGVGLPQKYVDMYAARRNK